MRRLILAFALVGALAGCKKDGDPPPPETDPEKIKQIEQQAEDAGRQEGQARPKGEPDDE